MSGRGEGENGRVGEWEMGKLGKGRAVKWRWENDLFLTMKFLVVLSELNGLVVLILFYVKCVKQLF